MLSRLISRKGKGTKRSNTARRRDRVRQKRRWLGKGFTRLTLLTVLLALIGGAYWAYSSSAYTYGMNWAQRKAIELSADAGFTVQNFLVEGREYSDADALMALINVRKGEPLFSFDPDSAKKLIEEITWVEKAHVERRLPDTIYIRLYERVPLALWRKPDGTLVLIDHEGKILTSENLERFADFVMVSGKGANKVAADLVAMLDTEPEMKKRLDVATWVEERRWTLHLKDGKTVLLPEKDKELALSKLMRKHEKEGVLDKAMTSIDARDPSRFIVQTPPGMVQDFKNDKGRDL